MTVTNLSVTLTGNDNVNNGLTMVQRFETAALTMPPGTISQMRFTFQAAAAEGFTVTNAYVGHAAGSGDAYDFSTTPVQILWGGSGSKAIAAGTEELSDWVSFSYDKTSPLLIAFYFGGGTSVDAPKFITGLGTNYARYYKTANDAATVNKTGYTGPDSGYLIGINKIESDGDASSNPFWFF